MSSLGCAKRRTQEQSQGVTVPQRPKIQGALQTTLHSLHIPETPQWASNRSRGTGRAFPLSPLPGGLSAQLGGEDIFRQIKFQTFTSDELSLRKLLKTKQNPTPLKGKDTQGPGGMNEGKKQKQ